MSPDVNLLRPGATGSAIARKLFWKNLTRTAKRHLLQIERSAIYLRNWPRPWTPPSQKQSSNRYCYHTVVPQLATLGNFIQRSLPYSSTPSQFPPLLRLGKPRIGRLDPTMARDHAFSY